jgi:hypothetical protein
MANNDHASATIAAFVAPERRDRYLGLLASARGRAKMRDALAHFRDLDARYARPVAPADQAPGRLAALLRSRGAPADCYLLAEDAALDGLVLPLEEALAAVVGRGMGAFVSCVPGRLAYYEGEDAGERYLLERAA